MWDTSCRDWEARLLAGKSLVPKLPLFKNEAELALRVFKSLRLPDVIGTPTMEEACGEWFFPIVAALFGSYDPKTHVRQIQEFFQLIPKGNSKSSNGGAVMLTAFVLNQRPEAEFLFIAPTIEIASDCVQAGEGHDPAGRGSCRRFARCRITSARSRIRRPARRCRSRRRTPTSSPAVKAVGTMIDETHVFAKKGNAKDVFIELRGALTKRSDGFLFQTTTQSKQPPSGVFASELEMARKVRDGKMKMPMLPVLYELPDRLAKNNGWKERKYWPLVNPNLGRSTSADFLEREVMRAEEEGASSLALIASQHFNVQIGMSLRSDGWAGAEVWERGIEPGLTLDEILARSEVVTIGVDGGGLDDLLGVGLIGRERGTKRWLGWAHALISDIGIERRKANAAQYDRFEREGSLTKFNYMRPETAVGRAAAEHRSLWLTWSRRCSGSGCWRRSVSTPRGSARLLMRSAETRRDAGRREARCGAPGHWADGRGEDDRDQACRLLVPAWRQRADGVVRREHQGCSDAHGHADRARRERLRQG